MSFGYSVGDFIALTQIAYNTVQNARKACGAHDNLTREVDSLHIVLNRLRLEVVKPDSLLGRKEDNRKKELSTLARNCRRVLRVLLQILEKYNALSDEKRSATQLWQRVKFGNGEMQDLEKIRGELAAHTQAITLFLNMLAIGSQGKVEAYMDTHGKDLKDIKRSLNWVTANLQAVGSHEEKSILTTYTEDDKLVWKTFRRELIKEGFSSQLLNRHRKVIKDYVLELGNRGLLDEVIGSEETLEVSTQDIQRASVAEESSDLFAPGPSTPSKPKIMSQDIASNVASDEESDFDKETEDNAEPVVEILTSPVVEIGSDKRRRQDQENANGSDLLYTNFAKSKDKTYQKAQEPFFIPESFDGSTLDDEQDSESDASSHLNSNMRAFQNLSETDNASEKMVRDYPADTNLPSVLRRSDEEKLASLKSYRRPTIEDIEDEDFLPGAHPNCLIEDKRDHLSYLLGQSFQIRYARFKEDEHTRNNNMSQEENRYNEEVEEEEMMHFAMTVLGEDIEKQQIEIKKHKVLPVELIIVNSKLRRAAMEVFLYFQRKYLNVSTISINGLGQPRVRDEGRVESLRASAHMATVTFDIAKKLRVTTKLDLAESPGEQLELENNEIFDTVKETEGSELPIPPATPIKDETKLPGPADN